MVAISIARSSSVLLPLIELAKSRRIKLPNWAESQMLRNTTLGKKIYLISSSVTSLLQMQMSKTKSDQFTNLMESRSHSCIEDAYIMSCGATMSQMG